MTFSTQPEAAPQAAGAPQAPVRRVSYQGTQLSASERLAVQLRQQVNSFMNPVLKQSVDAAIAENERKRAEQIPFDDPYRYRLDFVEKGTPFVGDAFGF